MDVYCKEVRKLKNKFSGLEFHHIVRDNNVAADTLSKMGSTRAEVPAGIFVHELRKSSISDQVTPLAIPTADVSREIMMIEVDWRTPFFDYIKDHQLPSDKNKAEQTSRRVKNYGLVGDKLYRKGALSRVLMKCVTREDGQEILEEIHRGICGNHASPRTLVGKAFRAGFYWPMALADAKQLVQTCKGCQFFTKWQQVPAYKLVTIPPAWPFACWGLDMIGPLPTALGGFNRVLVAIDKFTK